MEEDIKYARLMPADVILVLNAKWISGFWLLGTGTPDCLGSAPFFSCCAANFTIQRGQRRKKQQSVSMVQHLMKQSAHCCYQRKRGPWGRGGIIENDLVLLMLSVFLWMKERDQFVSSAL